MKRLFSGLIWCAFIAGGCQSPTVWNDAFRPDLGLPPHGEVVYVRPSYQYVVLKSPGPIQTGQEWTLTRQELSVGRIRVAGPRQGDYWTADILDGEPEVGDIIRP